VSAAFPGAVDSVADERKIGNADDRASDVPAVVPTRSSDPSSISIEPLASPFVEHVEISGIIQAEYLRRQISEDQLADGSGQPLNENRFLLRRARIGVDGEWRYVGTTMVAGLSTARSSKSMAFRPINVDIHAQIPSDDHRRPYLLIRAGLIPVAFGFESYGQSNAERFFGERSLVVRGFVPGKFDMGASIEGYMWDLHWTLAIQNGQPIDVADFSYGDPNDAKDLSARVRVVEDIFPRLKAAMAVSILRGTGFSPGTTPTKDTFEWQDLNEDGRVSESEMIPIPGSAGRPSENFSRWGASADAQLWIQIPRLGQAMIYAEIALGSNLDRGVVIADPIFLGRDQRSLGWYGAFTQALGHWVTVGLRYDRYSPNLDSIDLYGGISVVTVREFHALSGGLSTQVDLKDSVSLRLLGEYEGQRNALGLDTSGKPSHLKNDTFRLRLELIF